MKCQECGDTRQHKLNYVKGRMICNKCYKKEMEEKND